VYKLNSLYHLYDCHELNLFSIRQIV